MVACMEFDEDLKKLQDLAVTVKQRLQSLESSVPSLRTSKELAESLTRRVGAVEDLHGEPINSGQAKTIVDLTDRIAALEHFAEVQTTENKSVTDTISSDSRVAPLESENNALRLELGRYKETSKTYVETSEALELENLALKQKYEDALATQVTASKHIIDDLKRQLNEGNEEAQTTKRQLLEAEQRTETLWQMKQDLQRQIDEQGASRSEQDKATQDRIQDRKVFLDEINALQNELENLSAKHATLEVEHQSLQERLADDARTFQNELERLNADRTLNAERLNAELERLNGLSGQLQEKKDSVQVGVLVASPRRIQSSGGGSVQTLSGSVEPLGGSVQSVKIERIFQAERSPANVKFGQGSLTTPLGLIPSSSPTRYPPQRSRLQQSQTIPEKNVIKVVNQTPLMRLSPGGSGSGRTSPSRSIVGSPQAVPGSVSVASYSSWGYNPLAAPNSLLTPVLASRKGSFQ